MAAKKWSSVGAQFLWKGVTGNWKTGSPWGVRESCGFYIYVEMAEDFKLIILKLWYVKDF